MTSRMAVQASRILSTISENNTRSGSLPSAGFGLNRQESPLSDDSGAADVASSFEDLYRMTSDFLGCGVTAVVRVAVNKETREKVAVKTFNAGRSGTRSGSKTGAAKCHVQQVCHEVRILSGLDHPGMVKIHDFFTSQESSFLLMEYLTGGSILQHIQEAQRLTEMQTIRATKQVLSAVEYLHKQSLVHCDVKPANLVYATARKNQVKLVDFGLCVEWQEGDAPLMRRTGTPSYMAPEVSNKVSCYTNKVDLWSLGVTVHAMLTGKTIGRTLDGRLVFGENFGECNGTGQRFVEALLSADPKSRPSATEALRQEWLQDETVLSMWLKEARVAADPADKVNQEVNLNKKVDPTKKINSVKSRSDASTRCTDSLDPSGSFATSFFQNLSVAGSETENQNDASAADLVSAARFFQGPKCSGLPGEAEAEELLSAVALRLPSEATSGSDWDRQGTQESALSAKASSNGSALVRTESTMATLGSMSDVAMSTLSSLNSLSAGEEEEEYKEESHDMHARRYFSAPAASVRAEVPMCFLNDDPMRERSLPLIRETSKESDSSYSSYLQKYRSAPATFMSEEEPPAPHRTSSASSGRKVASELASFLWRSVHRASRPATRRVAPEMTIVPSPDMSA